MDITRRNLLSLAAAAATAPIRLAGARLPKPQFAVHPFVEANPKAVFLKRTNVLHKMDEAAKRREGLTFARDVFVPL